MHRRIETWMLAAVFAAACGDADVDRGAEPFAAALEPPPPPSAGDCGDLPDDFVCEPGASGPGVHDGDFLVDYGYSPVSSAGVNCVTGNLLIEASALTDLSALSSLRSVAGDLRIVANSQLTSLAGLEQLRDVGGALSIEQNSVLSDVSALQNLTRIDWRSPPGRVGALSIRNNNSLPQCAAWDIAGRAGHSCKPDSSPAGSCSGNMGEGECQPLPASFACVPGARGPGVHDGRMDLVYEPPWQLLNAEWRGVRCVTGDVNLARPSEQDLSGLGDLQKIGGSLTLRQHDTLTHVDALSRLEEIGGRLDIADNAALENLAGLFRLRKVGDDTAASLRVTGNPRLPSCWAWLIEEQLGLDPAQRDYARYLNAPHGWCGVLPSNFVCAPGARGAGVADSDIALGTVPPEALAGLTCVTGSLQVQSADLEVLRTLQKVGGDLLLEGVADLDSLDALDRLTEVGRHVRISGNTRLESLRGLHNLRGPLRYEYTIADNPRLSQCWVWEFSRQVGRGCWDGCGGNHGTTSCGELPADFACVAGAVGPGVYDGHVTLTRESADKAWGGLACITGTLAIQSSDLTDLRELSSLHAVGGSVFIQDNDHLTSVAGLENLERIGGPLFIDANPVLADLVGLSSLAHAGDETTLPTDHRMLINRNPSLAACWVERLGQQIGWPCPDAACYANDGSDGCAP